MGSIRYQFLGEFETPEKARYGKTRMRDILEAVWSVRKIEEEGDIERIELGKKMLWMLLGQKFYLWLIEAPEVEIKERYVLVRLIVSCSDNAEIVEDILYKFGADKVYKGSSEFPLLSFLEERGLSMKP